MTDILTLLDEAASKAIEDGGTMLIIADRLHANSLEQGYQGLSPDWDAARAKLEQT